MTIASFSLSSIMRQTVSTAQSSLADVEQEVTTGRYADIGLTLGADTGQSVALRAQESLLQTIEASNNTVSTTLNSTQNILTTLQSAAQSFLQTLIQTGNSATSAQTVQSAAANNLQALMSDLNTNVGGQYIFGGINSSVPPMTDNSSAVSSAFSSYLLSIGATSSNITAAQMQDFLDGNNGSTFPSLFQSGSGGSWNASSGTPGWSSASDTPIASQISPSQTVTTSVSANQTAFQQLTQAYAMVAHLDTSNLNASAYQTVVNTAETLVQNAVTGLTSLGASVGVAQSAITAANNYMSTQMSTLSTQIGNLENVDPYSVSTQATNLQTQIETAYQLTAQLQQLSLTKYL